MDALARRLTANDSVVEAVLGDEAVLLHVERGIYFGLDAVGTRIWELLKQGTTEEEIIARLHSEYEVSPAQLRNDVLRFVQALEAKGLTQELVE